MSRAIRKMNLAGMDDADLAAMREGVAKALADCGEEDREYLLEDIDAEINLRTREPV